MRKAWFYEKAIGTKTLRMLEIGATADTPQLTKPHLGGLELLLQFLLKRGPSSRQETA